MVVAYNSASRGVGLTVFCYGWGDFDFEPGDLAELAEALA